MDKRVADLTVVEFYGVLGVAFAVFYLGGILIRVYDHNWPFWTRVYYWVGCFALFGLPIITGLRALA